MRFNKVIWSPIEIDYLKEHRNTRWFTHQRTYIYDYVYYIKLPIYVKCHAVSDTMGKNSL